MPSTSLAELLNDAVRADNGGSLSLLDSWFTLFSPGLFLGAALRDSSLVGPLPFSSR